MKLTKKAGFIPNRILIAKKRIYTQNPNHSIDNIATNKYLRHRYFSGQTPFFSHPFDSPTVFLPVRAADYLQNRNGFSAISSSGMVWSLVSNSEKDSSI